MDKSLIVETSAGKVAGTEVDGVRQWLGVPYAHAERFAAAGPAEPWKGVRAAKRFAPQCPQIFGSNPKRAQVGERFTERGCLALNIWAPASDPAPGRLRPVFFWIHGGAFCAGGSNIYRGAELARSGDIIVVGINYRLGVLGFVDFGGALDEPEIPSNLGLRDQIAALEWVRDNIAGFGGDPRKVTIAGESAGSISVSLLMVCRRAWPLFRGAIMQSGALTLIRGQDKAQELARSYLGLLGLGRREGLAGLRRLDVRTLLEAQAGIDGRQSANVPAVPWFDGDLLPASLDEALEHPHAEVPLIAGATREEVRLFEVLPVDVLPRHWADLEALLREQLSTDDAERVLATYTRDRSGRRALATDMVFTMPTRLFAERHARRHPTWYYRFDYSHPLLGACHGLDLLFLWPGKNWRATLARGGRQTGVRLALAQRMREHWAHFTKYCTPAEGWPRYRSDDRQVQIFDRRDRVVQNPDRRRLAAWEDAVIAPG